MIRVDLKPEYPDFDAQVRRPGATFLLTVPAPTSEQFKKKNYWNRAIGELHAAYSGICAYTAMYLPDRGSVDHFLPKTTYPQLAYEWNNFRLAGGRINSTKGNSINVLDPAEIQNGWFTLDLPSCLMRAAPHLPHDLRARINTSINSLRLNSDDTYVQERCSILVDFAKGDLSFGFLSRRYPFLAHEVQRQGIAGQLRVIFSLGP